MRIAKKVFNIIVTRGMSIKSRTRYIPCSLAWLLSKMVAALGASGCGTARTQDFGVKGNYYNDFEMCLSFYRR